MTKFREWKMKRKKLFLCILGIWGIVLTSCGTKEDTQEQEELSGVPDVASSAVFNTNYNLTVVANTDKIEDKEEFARTVIHMCQDNSFHTIKFSTDHGYPSELDIDVFLNRKDVEKRKEPVCKIEFKTDDFSKDYNIKENPDKFTLYLDGEEIEFY